jgi:hypothetical protein
MHHSTNPISGTSSPPFTGGRLFLLAGLLGLLWLPEMFCVADESWHIKTEGLLTRWAAQVSPDNALPDYPRPQMVRPDWLNLNGLWNYSITSNNLDIASHYAGKILVPYPLESALSGVEIGMNAQDTLWYERNFEVPGQWVGRRILLHFGAVDWSARVFVDGQLAGVHTGGYDPFTLDITPLLATNMVHDLIVQVTNPTENDQPRGKQSLKPENIFYTASSGIWQTVWLEPVPDTAITDLTLTPDYDTRCLRFKVRLNRFEPDALTEVRVFAAGREIAITNTPANSDASLDLPDLHPWSPVDPFLYDLQVDLHKNGKTVDRVTSYFGVRKISLKRDPQGFVHIALNNESLFQLGALDQGFWPDGIYTAPTDEALESDLRFLKQSGFNLVRKHVKVEPERWYYWCDKLGLLVWQDMPSGNNNIPQSRIEFETELAHMITGLRNHPAIVQWVLFNEGWGQYDTERLTSWVKNLDPTRLVDNASGWVDYQVGDVVDAHTYPDPETPPNEKDRASVIGEFGGLGLVIPDHNWSSNFWSYERLPDGNGLEVRYKFLLNRIWDQREKRNLSAAIYTQSADVETECDGLLTFDRAVQKISPDWLADINTGAYRKRTYTTVLSDALVDQPEWQYTLNTPPPDWMHPDFQPAGWQTGKAGFGTSDTAGSVVRTPWTTDDIWLRRVFSLGQEDLSRAQLHVHHDDDVEVYLNGTLALKAHYWLTDYGLFPINPAALATLKPGTNSIAVHCHQVTGSQYIDVGIVVPSPQ